MRIHTARDDSCCGGLNKATRHPFSVSNTIGSIDSILFTIDGTDIAGMGLTLCGTVHHFNSVPELSP